MLEHARPEHVSYWQSKGETSSLPNAIQELVLVQQYLTDLQSTECRLIWNTHNQASNTIPSEVCAARTSVRYNHRFGLLVIAMSRTSDQFIWCEVYVGVLPSNY